MADKTHIQWTEATWNPITGCSIISPGCTNCYAMKLAGTRLAHHPSRAGLTKEVNGNHVWNGEVRFNEQWLTQPLTWKKPRMIFVCAHADLFHEAVPDAWIDQIFAVMALTPHHTYQILTKRPERMRDYMLEKWQGTTAMQLGDLFIPAGPETGRDYQVHMACEDLIDRENLADTNKDDLWDENDSLKIMKWSWPLPNVWLGVSVEDQARADERIPVLLETPAALRWISAEPLLGPVDLLNLPFPKSCDCEDDRPTLNSLEASVYCPGCCEGSESMDCGTIDWVVVGGENGPRPMHPDWARSLRDQCAGAEVPFFFKQWGNFLPAGQLMADGRMWNPSSGHSLHAAKSLAGDFLDGVQHHNWPVRS